MEKFTITIGARFWDDHFSRFESHYEEGGEFENGAVEIKRGRSRVTVELTTDGLQNLAGDAAFYGYEIARSLDDSGLVRSARSALDRIQSVLGTQDQEVALQPDGWLIVAKKYNTPIHFIDGFQPNK